jgi:hypothetical protein
MSRTDDPDPHRRSFPAKISIPYNGVNESLDCRFERFLQPLMPLVQGDRALWRSLKTVRYVAAVLCLVMVACNMAPTAEWPSPSQTTQSSGFMDDAATKGPLLYATDASDNIVYVIALPSGKLAGKLTGFDQPQGDCADNKGNVFVTDTQAKRIVGYRHAAKEAYAVLDDPAYLPVGC